MLAELKSRRTALVTGASYGVGAATALALARDGFDIAVTATRTENLNADCGAARSDGCAGRATRPRPARANEHRAHVADAISAFGGLDLLVNNAGTNLRKRAVDVTPGAMGRGDRDQPDRQLFHDPAGRTAPDRAKSVGWHYQHLFDPRAGRRGRALDLRHHQGGVGPDDAHAGGRMGGAWHPRQRGRAGKAGDCIAVARRKRVPTRNICRRCSIVFRCIGCARPRK